MFFKLLVALVICLVQPLFAKDAPNSEWYLDGVSAERNKFTDQKSADSFLKITFCEEGKGDTSSFKIEEFRCVPTKIRNIYNKVSLIRSKDCLEHFVLETLDTNKQLIARYAFSTARLVFVDSRGSDGRATGGAYMMDSTESSIGVPYFNSHPVGYIRILSNKGEVLTKGYVKVVVK